MRPRISFLRTSIVLLAIGLLPCASPAAAQSPAGAAPRRHFVTVSYDWHHTQPLHFAEYPLAQLLGRDVASAPAAEPYDYRTRDGTAFVEVVEFTRRQQGASITLYPFGMGRGLALALRASREALPVIRLTISGQAPLSAYALTDARAVDGALGIYVADRAPGWGLGSHAFVLGGLGRITSGAGDGRRYFAEGGGGLSSGPIGVDLAVKFAWNRLSAPVEHRFLTVPVTLRGTLTF